jgi:glycosyltransferase involved in cell wall biosynthesis
MKILYASRSTIPSRAANSVHVMRMCAAFAALGHDVTLLAHGPADDGDHAHYGVAKNFTIIKLPPRRWHWLGEWLHAKRAVALAAAGTGFDLIYGRDSAALLRLCRLGIPLCFEAHAPPQNLHIEWCTRQLLRNSRCGHLVVISRALAEIYRKRYPWMPENRIVIEHDGADEAPAMHAADDRPIAVGYIGHLYGGRGIELIVAVAQRLPSTLFHIVGGTDNDVARWRATKPPANVTFHGFVRPADLPSLYGRFDIALAPYQIGLEVGGGKCDTSSYMSPLKIFEYMANGKAIVASDMPVLREVLHEGRDALLVTPTDLSAWSKTIAALAADPERIQRLGHAARTQFLAHHTWLGRARRILDALADGTP